MHMNREDVSSADKPLEITGDPRQVAKALDYVRKSYVEELGNGNLQHLEGSIERWEVNRNFVGVIIGRKGEKISSIRSKSQLKRLYIDYEGRILR